VGVVLSIGSLVWVTAWVALLVYLLLVRAAFGTLGSRPAPSTV
jgi:hypothetical protein